MGYLTTITFRNDAYSTFEKHPKELVKEILNALDGIQVARGDDYFSIGNKVNPVIVQKSRHADDTTLYLHASNTMIDISSLTEVTSRNFWAIDQAITEMEYYLKKLRNLKTNK